MTYAIEIQAADGTWAEIIRVKASRYIELTETFDTMCANSSDTTRLRLIKIIRDT